MIEIVIQLLVLGVVIGVLWWILDYLPVPQPMNKIIKVVALVIFLIAVIYLLLGVAHLEGRL